MRRTTTASPGEDPEEDPERDPDDEREDEDEPMPITADMVRKLRDLTGAPMMDCKRALEEAGGDFEAAEDNLRKQGLKTAAKKAGRETSEGRVAAKLCDSGRTGSLVAIRCETDFVANTEDFQRLLRDLTSIAFENELPAGEAGASRLSTYTHSSGSSVEEYLKQVIGKLGENLRIASAARFHNAGGIVAAYVHHTHKVGALVSLTTKADRARAQDLAKKVCQHVAVAQPAYLRRDEVPAEVVERERRVIAESEELASKPAEMRDKIVAGKVEKFFGASCLVEQPWTFDDKQKVEAAVKKELGPDASIAAFACFTI
ncbi:MAG TPA: translation elongation factor Ts [Planctomycetota bacterium]|nr:translation elongation factor Ts [Planctomycetota bacterium]